MDWSKPFEEKVNLVKNRLKELSPEEILLIYHDDADGLSSAAIVKACLTRAGYEVKLICLEKTYPMVLEKLHAGSGRVIFYCDIGSAHADWISQYNGGRNFVVILDHHDPKPASDENVLDLNLEHHGLKGETDFSGATICYLFARAFDAANKDLSYLAVVGSREIPGELKGLNKAVFEEALKEGTIAVKGREAIAKKIEAPISKLFSTLQVLGAVGYYAGGPEVGVEVCLHGLSEEAEEMAAELEEKRKKANKRMLAILYKYGLKRAEHVQWFDAGTIYKGMGTKVIGQFCSYLQYQKRLVDPGRYLVGFMNMEKVVPGFGELDRDYAKFSVRTPPALKKLVGGEKMPPAVELAVKASEEVGGFADGHAYAASGIIPLKVKEKLITCMEEVLKR